MLKAIAMILLGLLLSTVGTDLETGQERMTLRLRVARRTASTSPSLAMGMFGFAEILRNLENPETRDVVRGTIGRLLPSMARHQAVDRAHAARHRHRRDPRHPARQRRRARALRVLHAREEARQGSLAASARARSRAWPGPEAANNAGAQTAFIPLLTLGIPPNAVMALMVGAMTIHGIIPGPQVMTKNPDLFWGMIASMWIGNLMLLIINLPLVGRVGEAAEGALPADVPGDPDLLLHRHLLDQQQPDGRASSPPSSAWSAIC